MSVVRWVWIALYTAPGGRNWYRGVPSWVNEPPISRTESTTAIRARFRRRPLASASAKTSPTTGANPKIENSKIRRGMNRPPVTERGADATIGTSATTNKTSKIPAEGRAGPVNRSVRRHKMKTPTSVVRRRMSRDIPITASSSGVYENPAATPEGADPVGAMNWCGKNRRSRLSDAESSHASSRGLDTRADHERNMPVDAPAVNRNPLDVCANTPREAT